MFEKLIEFILNLIDDVLPITVVNQYDRGVILRFGRFKRVIEPGLRWKIPFVDKALHHPVVTTTLEIPSQTLTTADNKQVVAKSIVKYEIDDIAKFLLEVYDAKDAISDITQGIIKRQVATLNADECGDNDLDNTITKKLRVEMKKWGIKVDIVTLTSIGVCRSYKLFNEIDPSHLKTV